MSRSLFLLSYVSCLLVSAAVSNLVSPCLFIITSFSYLCYIFLLLISPALSPRYALCEDFLPSDGVFSSGHFLRHIVHIIILLPLFTFASLPMCCLPKGPPQSTYSWKCFLSFVTRTHCLSRPNKSCLYLFYFESAWPSQLFMARVVQLRPCRQECCL